MKNTCTMYHPTGVCTHFPKGENEYMPEPIPGSCNCGFFDTQVITTATWKCPVHGMMAKEIQL